MEDYLLEYILDVSRRMAETQDLSTLMTDVLDEAILLVGAERGCIVLTQADGSLDISVQGGVDSPDLEDAEDQISHSIVYQVVESGQPLVLMDAGEHPDFSTSDSVVILKLRSIMCVPLICRGRITGAVYVENRSIRGRFDEDEVAPLVLFANHVAAAIENARLLQALRDAYSQMEQRVEERTSELSSANTRLEHEIAEHRRAEEALKESREQLAHMATHDPLTDLPNRRLYNERLQRALSLAKRNNWHTAVMFLDMDNFKTINDTMGHEKGDEFIQAVAERLKGCLRESDTVARFGGDEFVFVLVNVATAKDAAAVAEKILKSLYDLFHSTEYPAQGVSASIGISLAPQDGDDPRKLLKRADEAMYRVKQRGKGTYGFYS